MNESFFKPHSEQSKATLGRKCAWWILGPFLGTIGGLFLGATVWLIFFLSLSGEGIGIQTIGWALAGYMILAAWFFAIMGFSVGIVLAIHRTSNLPR
jgi:hypothetical protein